MTTHVFETAVDGIRQWRNPVTQATIPHGGYGTYKPNATNTGLTIPEGSLTDYNSSAVDTVTLTDGVTIENKTIYGDIRCPSTHASDITLRNCLLVGGANNPSTEDGVVNAASGSRTGSGRLLMYDCEVRPRQKADGRDCVRGHRWEAYRCDFSGGVDIIGLMRSGGGVLDVLMMGCYCHDLVYKYPDMAHADGTHNDVVQHHSGTGFTLKGNTFEGSLGTVIGTPYEASATRVAAGHCSNGVLIQGDASATNIVEENWFEGSINQGNLQVSCTWKNNRHSTDTWLRQVFATTGGTYTDIATNEWADGPDVGELLTTGNGGLVYT